VNQADAKVSHETLGQALKLPLAKTRRTRHAFAVTATVRLDPSNRIVLSPKLRRAAGISPRQKLKVSAAPGRIILEVASVSKGKIVKKNGFKVWAGKVPPILVEQAVEHVRHYER
jgi:hypothetical protein